MKKTRILSLILAGLMIGGSFISCSDNQVEESDTTPSVESDSSETSVDEETGTTYYNDMAAVDMNGWNISFCGGNEDVSSTGTVRYIWVENITGDEFDDALYNRVISVGDKYNVTFNFEKVNSDDVPNILKTSVTAGTKDYQMASTYMEDMSVTIIGGYARPVTDASTINFDMPWWDQKARKTFTFNDKMYYILSGLSYNHYESISLLYYNGVILDKNQITETPYDLWKEGKWTFDAMYTMTEKVTSDTNGDGVMEEGVDIYGLVGRILRYQPQLAASGVNFYDYSPEEGFTLDFTDEAVVAVGEWTRKLCIDSPYAHMGTDNVALETFKSGFALFNSYYLGNFRLFRDQEDDYGLIQWPTLEEGDDGLIYVRNPFAQVVAADVGDDVINNLGTIIEAMGAYSQDYIIDNYIKRAVIGKGARDPQSAEVIVDMMDRLFYDNTYALGINIVVDAWERAVTKSSYASFEQKISKTFYNAVETALEPYSN